MKQWKIILAGIWLRSPHRRDKIELSWRDFILVTFVEHERHQNKSFPGELYSAKCNPITLAEFALHSALCRVGYYTTLARVALRRVHTLNWEMAIVSVSVVSPYLGKHGHILVTFCPT